MQHVEDTDSISVDSAPRPSVPVPNNLPHALDVLEEDIEETVSVCNRLYEALDLGTVKLSPPKPPAHNHPSDGPSRLLQFVRKINYLSNRLQMCNTYLEDLNDKILKVVGDQPSSEPEEVLFMRD